MAVTCLARNEGAMRNLDEEGFVVSGQGLEADVTKEEGGYRFTLSRVTEGNKKEPITLKDIKEEEFEKLVALGNAAELFLSRHKEEAKEVERWEGKSL
jgi:hypothetical protein